MSSIADMSALDEPTLTFGFGQSMEHPKDGLLLYGPYLNPFAGGSLRIGLISTTEGEACYTAWVKQAVKAIEPLKNDDPNHTVFPGFSAVFRTTWPMSPVASIIVDALALRHAIRMEDRHQAIYKAVSIYADAITDFIRERSETSVDLWIVVIPEEIYRLGRPQSKVTKDERLEAELHMNFRAATRILREPSLFQEDNQAAEIYRYELNFHNQLKARLLKQRAVIQVIRETTLAPERFKKSNGQPLRRVQDPATLAWNLSTTAFFKAGGKPWQLSAPRAGVCYVGVVFKRDLTGPSERNACCGAQMFLDSGDGVVFRGAVGPWYAPDNGQFHLTREKARELMTLVVGAYRQSHNGAAPSELFIHGKTRFSRDEWLGFCDAVPDTCSVTCIRIQEDSSLKLFRRGMTNISRGLAWRFSRRRAYLWSRGFITRLQTYPGREVPNPLSIEIVQGDADIDLVLNDVLSLTKLNYNTCIYADGLPVTLRFADQIGEILTAGPVAEDLPPLPFRYYI